MSQPDDDDLPISIGSRTRDPDSPPVGRTHLGAGGIGGGIKGVNDGSEEIVDVRISRHEAEILIRHWFKTYWDNAMESVYSSGSREWRVSAYSGYRFDTFDDVISQECKEFLDAEAIRQQAELDAYRASLEEDSE